MKGVVGMVYVFLADGFEEVEALTPVDVLRRAEIPVCIVGVGNDTPRGAHGITVQADCREEAVQLSALSGVILPGGMPGTLNLERSAAVQHTLDYALSNKLLTAAICAAPSILGYRGDLQHRTAVCYPGFEDSLEGAVLSKEAVVVDRNIITARGAGVALDFALAIVSVLRTPQLADEIRGMMQCP